MLEIRYLENKGEKAISPEKSRNQVFQKRKHLCCALKDMKILIGEKGGVGVGKVRRGHSRQREQYGNTLQDV